MIERTDIATKEKMLLTLTEAIDKLSGYWEDKQIKPMLLSGETLFTPYATYKLIETNKKQQP